MADNYLENRMDAYRSGRLARNSRTSASMRRPARPNTLTLTYPELHVAVLSTQFSPLLKSTVSALRSIGAKVAFSCPAMTDRNATLFAQESGARYYPASAVSSHEFLAADLTRLWGRLDFLIDLQPESVIVNSTHTIPLPSGADPEAIARYLLFLLHPTNASLL